MQGIELKEFQINCVNKLLDATTVGNKKEILVQAPTGSGKTRSFSILRRVPVARRAGT